MPMNAKIPHYLTQKRIALEKGSRNVYTDLGFPESEDMLVKAQLVTRIAEIIRQRRLAQAQAANLLLSSPTITFRGRRL